MKKSILESQLKEIQELRSKLNKSPVAMQSPVKIKGLQIVAMPLRNDSSLRDFRQRAARRATTLQTRESNTLASKLKGFRVA